MEKKHFHTKQSVLAIGRASSRSALQKKSARLRYADRSCTSASSKLQPKVWAYVAMRRIRNESGSSRLLSHPQPLDSTRRGTER